MQLKEQLKFLADMGISQSTTEWLHKCGYNTLHLREQNLQRLTDNKIIVKAKQEHRIILTCDLDFGELLAASKEKLPSVIIFRLLNQTPENINKHLERVLKNSSLHLINGAVIIVEESRYRIRALPI